MKKLALAFILLSNSALSHEWYPESCCSNQDCFSMAHNEIEHTAEGYYIRQTGELIPYNRARRTPAEGNGQFHRCSLQGDRTAPTLGRYNNHKHCFWAPEYGS